MATQTELQYISDAQGHAVGVIVPIELWQTVQGFAIEPDALQLKFDALVSQWRRETATFSSTSKIVTHPAYQRIMAMGEKAVPLILRELQREPEHWFYALRNITEATPVSPDDAGDVAKMAASWIAWGRENHYVR
jgi:hypothetical protein